jgi:hypothetical protein
MLQNTKIDFRPLTSIRRIYDIDIPKKINIRNIEVNVPNSFLSKDISYIVDNTNGKVKGIRTAWINKSLAHFLNAHRFLNTYPFNTKDNSYYLYTTELEKAIKEAENYLGNFIKNNVLKDKKGPGFMSFVQSNCNIPEDSILISKRTYSNLCANSKKSWENLSELVVTRFPNLGPNTTIKLKVIISDFYSDGNQVLDAVYLNNNTLKNCLQGDGDGDTLFCVVSENNGCNVVENFNLTRLPADENFFDSEFSTLFRKSNRHSNKQLSTYLTNYFNNTPIALATYVIKFNLYNTAKKFKNSDFPLTEAWNEISQQSIDLIEFVMDIRKGDYTNDQINSKINYINSKMLEIKESKESGNIFTSTVTSKSIDDIPGFLSRFKTLQQFIDEVYLQK